MGRTVNVCADAGGARGETKDGEMHFFWLRKRAAGQTNDCSTAGVGEGWEEEEGKTKTKLYVGEKIKKQYLQGERSGLGRADSDEETTRDKGEETELALPARWHCLQVPDVQR